ncbi:hypothetical protein JRF84_25110 [Methylobacterium organophilum]|uniref:hypothetical protein n=1 Tax=Methylobacterium organophilum TaxID=410 RepID=UPI0019D2B38B|nr:hypothetical protein [Methylobacterium organophilum]MBN6822847.1 hypothetical protein [Methylobacterium organophilum]
MPTTKIFRGHIDGFTFITADLGAMQAWIDARRIDCAGKLLSLHQGVGTVRPCGSITATFEGTGPSREAVL